MSTTLISSVKPRQLATFHPDIWGERFLNYTPEADDSTQLIQELKKKVQEEVIYSRASIRLHLIDDIQRLAVAYHFEEEIEAALRHVYDTFQENLDQDDDLYTISFRFRLLRQLGFDASSGVFNKFMDESGKFHECLAGDIKGMLCLYEAANLRKPEGDDILEEALAFTITRLRKVVTSDNHSSNPLVPQIIHALKQPLLKNLPRLEARRYIPIYADNVSHNKDLLKLAKLDFNLLQSLHKQELCDLVRWWKDMGMERKLPYARSRMVELYFWVNGMHPEPQYRLSRMILTKVLAVTSVIDDTYDSYGTFEELQLLTTAVESWSEDCIDQLPGYLKVCYQLLLDTYEEIEDEMAKQDQFYRVPYAKRAMKRLVQAYFKEARWLNEAHIPSFDEYMGNAYISSGCCMISIASILGMGDATITKEAFDWFENDPKIVLATSTVGRLLDDIASHKFEQEREHIESAVEVYMKEYNVTEEHAIEELQVRVDRAWKDINEALIVKHVPMTLLAPTLNLARGLAIAYLDGKDGYTIAGPRTKEIITSLFIDPVPV